MDGECIWAYGLELSLCLSRMIGHRTPSIPFHPAHPRLSNVSTQTLPLYRSESIGQDWTCCTTLCRGFPSFSFFLLRITRLIGQPPAPSLAAVSIQRAAFRRGYLAADTVTFLLFLTLHFSRPTLLTPYCIIAHQVGSLSRRRGPFFSHTHYSLLICRSPPVRSWPCPVLEVGGGRWC